MSLKLGLFIVININFTIHRSALTSVAGCVLYFSTLEYVGIVPDNQQYEIFSRGCSNHGGRRHPMAPRSRHWGRKQLANILRNKSVPSKLEKNIIINIFMAILVMTLCERAGNHGGRHHPTATLWPYSRRWGTLQSAYILRNKFKLVNLKNTIVIYTIMRFKGMACCVWHLAIWSKIRQ